MRRLGVLVLVLSCAGGQSEIDRPDPARGDEARPVAVRPAGDGPGSAGPADSGGHEAQAGSRGDMERIGCEQGRIEDCVAFGARSLADRRDANRLACQRGGHLCANQREDPALLERGCRRGSGPACEAWMGRSDAPPAARELACDAGLFRACSTPVAGCGGTLADCVRRSREALAAGDTETARRLAGIGCDGERTAGCVAWAEAHATEDPDASRVALHRACLAEDRVACDALLARDDLPLDERRTAEALARGLAF